MSVADKTNEVPTPQNTPAPGQPPAPTPNPSEDEDLEAQLAYENLKRRREAKKRKRIIIIAVVAVIALVGFIVFISGQANEAAEGDGEAELVTGMAYLGDFSTTVQANGATEPVDSTVVTPEVDGIIENLQVQEGSYVSAGDVLFTLKNESLDKEVSDANAELQSAQRAANSANRAVDDAYDAYNRAVDAYNDSDGETEFDETALQSAIDSAEDNYANAVSALQSAQSKLDDAKENADKRTVRAPVSGTIVSMSAQNGAAFGSVTGGSSGSGSSSSGPLVQISNLSQMKVTVQVNEVDISSIAEGQEAKATFSALPGVELSAKVQRIASVSTGSSSGDGGSYGGGGGGVVTYAVDLIIPDPDPNLKPGMTATVTITTQSAPNTIIVPSAAVQESATDDGTTQKYVTVVDDVEAGTTHDVPVQVVMENSSEAAITGDVKDGDAVLLGGGAGADDTGEYGDDGMAVETSVYAYGE